MYANGKYLAMQLWFNFVNSKSTLDINASIDFIEPEIILWNHSVAKGWIN